MDSTVWNDARLQQWPALLFFCDGTARRLSNADLHFQCRPQPSPSFPAKTPPSFRRAPFALFSASNMVKTRSTRTRAPRMTATFEDSITRAQDGGRDATESQSETQPHTARRSARNPARPHLPAPSRVGAATEVDVLNSAQRLGSANRCPRRDY